MEANLNKMDRNYAFATLPSYLKYSRREITKPSNNSIATDTAYANIRQKISSASISVPYEKGLETLRALNNAGNTKLPAGTKVVEIGSISKLQKRKLDTITKPRAIVEKKKDKHVPDVMEPRTPRARLGSEGGSSVKSNESKQTPRQKGSRLRPPLLTESSNISTVSSRSNYRPTSYASSWGTESMWSDKLDEIKERYSENSEFLSTIRRPSDTLALMNKIDTAISEMPVTAKERISPPIDPHVSTILSVQKPKQFNKTSTKVLKDGFLPPISVQKDEDQTSSVGSYSDDVSVTQNLPVVKRSQENKKPPKRRKVEFNLQPKRPVRLPPLPSTADVQSPRKPKSILKKIDELSFVSSPLSASERQTEGQYSNQRWQVHLPKLRSPVPFINGNNLSRKQQIVFQRQHLRFTCSKEFETVATDIGSDKTFE